MGPMFIAFSKIYEDNSLDCSIGALDEALSIFVQLFQWLFDPNLHCHKGVKTIFLLWEKNKIGDLG